MPSGLPESVKSALIAVRAAKEAGIDVAPSLTSELKHAGRTGLDRTEHAKNLLQLRMAAARIGFSKSGSEYLKKCADQDNGRSGIFKRAAGRLAASETKFRAQHKVAQKALRGGAA